MFLGKTIYIQSTEIYYLTLLLLSQEIEDVSLVEFMYPVFTACQVELLRATRVSVIVCLVNVLRQLIERNDFPLFVDSCCRRRKALCLQHLWSNVHTLVQPQRSQALTHWPEAVCVRTVWSSICCGVSPEAAHEKTQRRETFQV